MVRCTGVPEPSVKDADPFRRLPDEILAEMFSWGDTVLVPCRRTTTYTVTKVCRRWRSVAISTPALWSAVNLYDLNWQHPSTKVPTTKAGSIFADFMKTCFARSAGRLLDLKIGPLKQEVLPLVAATSPRWGKLWVHEQMLESLMDCGEFRGLLDLRHLSLSGTSTKASVRSTQKQLSLPRLVSLHWRIDSPTRATAPRIRLAAPSLTHAHIGFQYPDISVAHVSAILKTLPAITHLHIESHGGCRYEDPSTGIVPLIRLQQVKRLSLRLSDSDATHSLLSHLLLPSLTHLRIEESSFFATETVQHPVLSVERMLAGVPRNVESFSAQFNSGFERFLRVVSTLRPRRIAFADRFYEPDPGLNALIRELFLGEDHVARVEELSVFNTRAEIDGNMGALFVESLIETAQCAAQSVANNPPMNPGSSPSTSLRSTPAPDHPHRTRKRFDVHFDGPPVGEWALDVPEVPHSSRSDWDVHVHHHEPTRRRRYCRLADDYWSTSTGSADLAAKPRTLI